MRFLFTLFSCVIITYAQAQSGAVRGRLFDTNQTPQVGIAVRLENTALATSTDGDGTFFLDKVPPGQYTLLVSGVGYAALKHNILVKTGQVTRLQLALDPGQQELQEVVVTGRRPFDNSATGATRIAAPLKDVPQSIQIVNQSTLQQQQVYRVDEALKNVAGVNESSAWGSFAFRGFETNSTNFLTNGMKGTGNPEGIMPFLANVERIEVLRGASAILYGEGAVGGNVNLITKQPRKTTALNARLSGGTFGLFRAQADVAGSLTADKRLYAVAGVGYENGGQFTRDLHHRSLQLFSSLRWEPGVRTSWQVNATYNRDRSTRSIAQDVPMYPNQLFAIPDNFRLSGNDAFYQGDSYQLQSQLQHQVSDRWTANLWLGYAEGRTNEAIYSDRGLLDSTGTLQRRFVRQAVNTPTRTLNAFATGRFSLGNTQHRLTAGLDLTDSDASYPIGIRRWVATPLNVQTPDYSAFNETTAKVAYYSRQEKFVTNTSGVYVQDQIALGEKLKALVGVRLNHYYFRYSADDLSYDLKTYEQYKETPDNTTAFIPRVGLVYQPTVNHSFYIDYNTGFVPQYLNSVAYGGPFDPEQTQQGEVGWKGDFLNHQLVPTVAIYQITKQNVLNLDYEALDKGEVIFHALGGVRSRGVETTLTGTVRPGWQVILNYSYNDTQVTQSNLAEEIGQQFANTPHHLGSLWTTYTVSSSLLKGLLIGGGYRYTGDRYSTSRNAETDALIFPAYGVVDAVIGYRYRQLSLQVNGNNLLNQRYVRSGFANSYFPGTPRTVLLTLGFSL